MELTPAQKQAVEHGDGNLQLIACAGSGKTEGVARRVVHLLTPGRPDSLLPRNIIVFSFTDKAAVELKERIFTRIRGFLEKVLGMAEMFPVTLLALCQTITPRELPEFLQVQFLHEDQQGRLIVRLGRIQVKAASRHNPLRISIVIMTLLGLRQIHPAFNHTLARPLGVESGLTSSSTLTTDSKLGQGDKH